MIIKPTLTEEEFWEKVNTPVELTKDELKEMNRVPTYEEIQDSIKNNGMGFITYTENHKGKRIMSKEKNNENLALFGKEEIQITKEELEKAKLENEKDKEALEVPTFISINTKQ